MSADPGRGSLQLAYSILAAAGSGSAGSLMDRLLAVVAEGTVGPGGYLTLPPEALPLLRAVVEGTSASGTSAIVERVFDTASWLTTAQAAARTGRTDRWMRTLARTGRIDAREVGGRWLLSAGAVDRYAATAKTMPATGAEHGHADCRPVAATTTAT